MLKNIPLEIKQLLQEKQKARAVWHRTHNPTTKTRYNQLANKLKAKLKEMRDAAFTDYIHNLSRLDYSVWKPIKKKNQPKPYLQFEYPHQLKDLGQEAIKKKPLFMHNTSQIFLLRTTMKMIQT
jgi:hypothetical protein